MSIMVDRHVGQWTTKAVIDFMPGYDEPNDWMIVVVGYLSVPMESIVKSSLEIGVELSSSLESRGRIWDSPQWEHVSYLLEPA